jgi:hypothetical protein
MAKLNKGPITGQDLTEFVNADSDFGFEMRVLKHLRAIGFTCSHSGTYRDPITDKIRQYDIRAHKDRGDLTLALAVECKNFRPNYPLLLSAVPRTEEEAFHDLLVCRPGVQYHIPEVKHIVGDASVYKVGEMVGKKTDQVGRETSGELASADEAAFEKRNQAVNSCQDLVQHFVNKLGSPLRRAIIPVLVTPTGLLWQVDYDADGSITTAPRQVDRASLFFDHAWVARTADMARTLSYRLSHIEIVTFDALSETTKAWLGAEGFLPLA